MSLTTTQKHLQAESQEPLKIGHKRPVGCAITYLILAFISLFLGLISTQYDFQDLALDERIRLRPGLPPYEKWRNPNNVNIGVKVYLFTVENPTEFLTNKTAKLKLKEIGPIYYKKIMRQEDVVIYDENSTMSFSTAYRLEFIEEMNEPGILNKTVTIVNPIVMGVAAIIHDHFLAKLAFDFLANKDNVFLNCTVYEVLWNITSPMLELVKQIPFAVPRPNAGYMFNSFYPNKNRYNVNIGTKHGYENFFKINTINGLSRIAAHDKNYPKQCPFSLKGAREGTGFPPHITKDTVFTAIADNLCRTIPVFYNQTIQDGVLETYEFIFSPDIYKRNEDPEKDCLRQTAGALLPDGLMDSSNCALGSPLALSNPHFWGFTGEWDNYLEGIAPNLEKHSSHIIIEPVSGIQLDAVVRIQSNMPLPSLEYYPIDVKRFSNMILPQFWMEYSVKNNDKLTRLMIIFLVNLPVIQPIIVILLLALSLFSIYKTVKLMMTFNFKQNKKSKVVHDTDTSEHYISAFSENSINRTVL